MRRRRRRRLPGAAYKRKRTPYRQQMLCSACLATYETTNVRDVHN